ncbi:flavin reductase [Micromonospora sp. LOL_015]|uniref:flavin reductase n=1 Tax=Micromonospora sp. LOL_015 TaxID=3345416 RepID=UPI003A89A4FA
MRTPATGREPVHEPTRPSWCCAVCPDGTPWPCPPGRTQLAEAYVGEPVALSVDVGELLTLAAEEAGITDPAELHERFVSWTWIDGTGIDAGGRP